MFLLISLIIPILLFFFESYPRFFNKYFGVDVWTRLIETDHVRRNNHRIPGKIKKGFIIDGYFDYPPLFPFLLSFIPKKYLEKIQGFIAPFFDSLHCIVVFIIAYQLTNRLEIALGAQIIYMFTPLIVLENSYLTPRSFGYLNFTLALYPLLIYSSSPKLIYLLIGFIFTTLIFLSHRFATQSFLLAVLLFTLLDRTLFYIALFVLSALTAILITKGYYLKVLKGHYYNIYFWVLNYNLRFSHQVKGLVTQSRNKDIISKMYYILGTFSPITLIGTNIWLISAFLFIYMRIMKIPIVQIENPMFYKMSIWVIFFYLFAVTVLSVKRLIPIGEGQRYVEMATAPIAILSSIIFFSLLKSPYSIISIIAFLLILITNFSLILIVQRKGIISDKDRTLTSDMKNVYKFINKLDKTPRIICIPHQITTMTIYNTKADILVNANNPGLMMVQDFYPILKKPIKELAVKFKLDYLLLRKNFAKPVDLRIKNPKIVYSSGDIVLIKLT